MKKITIQQAFDIIVKRSKTLVRAEGETSDREWSCSYRAIQSAGQRAENCCFVGILISDDLYDPRIEGAMPMVVPESRKDSEWNNSILNDILCKIIDFTWEEESRIMHILAEVQRVHDDWECKDWHTGLKKIALKFGLNYNKKVTI